jgi:hypothetical protein
MELTGSLDGKFESGKLEKRQLYHNTEMGLAIFKI